MIATDLSQLDILDGKPPVGDLRFRRSQPSEPWDGVLNGTKEAKKAFQPNVLMPESCLREGGEDCLYLNVYTGQHQDSTDEDDRLTEGVPKFRGRDVVLKSTKEILIEYEDKGYLASAEESD